MFFGLFKNKKGCLYDKTELQKVAFFESLAKFAITDKKFFKEQYSDLLPNEKKQFSDWVIRDGELKKGMKSLVNVIEKLLEQKHGR